MSNGIFYMSTYLCPLEKNTTTSGTSNIVTKVYNSFKDHPVDFLYKNDFSISINTDGRTISDTNLNNEYGILGSHFNWIKSHFLKVNINSMEASFANLKIKTKIISLLKSSYN